MRDPNTTPTILIRPARADECGIISSLLYRSFISFRPLYTQKAFDATAASDEDVLQRMREGPVWLAEISGKVAGTLGAVAEQDALYLRGMAVLPEARGRRIGRALLEHAENFARAEGYSRLLLTTTSFLQGAISLYRSFGFNWTGKSIHPFGTELLYMEKMLGS